MAISWLDDARRNRSRRQSTARSKEWRATVSRTLQRLAAPHRASLANLRAIPLTFTGAGCIDYAAFHLAAGWGWLVTGLSLVLLEYVIADGE